MSAKLTPLVRAFKRKRLTAVVTSQRLHVPVCLFEQLSCSFVLCYCMQQIQRWWVVALCLWSDASPRAQYECENCGHANCQREEGGAAIRRWRHRHINTHPQAYQHTHSNSAVPSLTTDPVSWLVPINRVFWKRDYIGGRLLCSTSVQWWHHSVWDMGAIFSLRQRAEAGASPASIQGLAQTHSVVEGRTKLALSSMTCSFSKRRKDKMHLCCWGAQ